jgi:cysteine synthase A
MPDWMSRERVDIIRSLGASVVPVTREQGGFVGSIRLAEDLAALEKNVFLPRQFQNDANVVAHELTTGPEIWWQLSFSSLVPAAFIAGVGTGGTVMRVGRFFRAQSRTSKVHPLEPAESPTLALGHKAGHHRIQGISDEFIPQILDLESLDDVVDVSDGDAILMAQNELGADAVVAIEFPDDNKKYLSTSLLQHEPVKNGYVSPDVELVDYHAFKRVCHTCCEMDECPQRLPRE